MPKEEWGTKRICPTTGKRFYDLNKSPIISPYTGDEVVPDTGKGKRSLAADKADASAKKEAAADEEEIVLEDDDANDENEADLGDDVLDDDDENDDVSLDEIKDAATGDDDG